MAWYLYDRRGYIDQVATYQGMLDILQMNITPLNVMMTTGGADETIKQDVLAAIDGVPELQYLHDMLVPAEPPLIITDGGGDERLDQFHSESEYTDVPEEDSIQSVEDAVRIYAKYGGQRPR
jgi:hypothetical protein